MATSIHTADNELRAYGGHFLVGDYSPARRSTALPAIPARASAYPDKIVKIRSRHTRLSNGEAGKNFTSVPTMPQPRPVWQYETLNYVAESSFAALSLALTDTDAVSTVTVAPLQITPVTEPKKIAVQPREHSITERLHTHDIAAIDTVPPLLSHAFGAGKHTLSLQPVERIRWWLLQPGRLEFLLWLVGTILLILVSLVVCLLLLSSLGYLVIH